MMGKCQKVNDKAKCRRERTMQAQQYMESTKANELVSRDTAQIPVTYLLSVTSSVAFDFGFAMILLVCCIGGEFESYQW
jgi:hypothetical protein